jgi:hypothetical protein
MQPEKTSKEFEALRRGLFSGSVAGLLSLATALVLSRRETGDADGVVNAVSHIAWGGTPLKQAARPGLNTVVGTLLHQGASIFWAFFYERFGGTTARHNSGAAMKAAATTAVVAYVVDYHVVPKRFQPGFEARLSGPSMFAVYAAFATGFWVASVLRQKGLTTIK